jgi:hypothetical protein
MDEALHRRDVYTIRAIVRMMRVRLIGFAIALVGVIGCLPERGEPLGFPRIRTWETEIDAVGGKVVFTLDPGGRFVLESWTEVSPGKFSVKGCPGELPINRVAPVFARFDAAALDGIKQEYREAGRTDGPLTLMLYIRGREAGHPRDQAEFDQLDPLVDELRAEARLLCLAALPRRIEHLSRDFTPPAASAPSTP